MAFKGGRGRSQKSFMLSIHSTIHPSIVFIVAPSNRSSIYNNPAVNPFNPSNVSAYPAILQIILFIHSCCPSNHPSIHSVDPFILCIYLFILLTKLPINSLFIHLNIYSVFSTTHPVHPTMNQQTSVHLVLTNNHAVHQNIH